MNSTILSTVNADQASSGDALDTPAENLADKINALHQEICDLDGIVLEKAIRIGRLLADQKAKLKHGEWLPWRDANVSFDPRTAQNYVRLFENRELLNTKGVSYLSLTDAYKLLQKKSLATKPKIESEAVAVAKPTPPATSTVTNNHPTESAPGPTNGVHKTSAEPSPATITDDLVSEEKFKEWLSNGEEKRRLAHQEARIEAKAEWEKMQEYLKGHPKEATEYDKLPFHFPEFQPVTYTPELFPDDQYEWSSKNRKKFIMEQVAQAWAQCDFFEKLKLILRPSDFWLAVREFSRGPAGKWGTEKTAFDLHPAFAECDAFMKDYEDRKRAEDEARLQAEEAERLVKQEKEFVTTYQSIRTNFDDFPLEIEECECERKEECFCGYDEEQEKFKAYKQWARAKAKADEEETRKEKKQAPAPNTDLFVDESKLLCRPDELPGFDYSTNYGRRIIHIKVKDGKFWIAKPELGPTEATTLNDALNAAQRAVNRKVKSTVDFSAS